VVEVIVGVSSIMAIVATVPTLLPALLPALLAALMTDSLAPPLAPGVPAFLAPRDASEKPVHRALASRGLGSETLRHGHDQRQ